MDIQYCLIVVSGLRTTVYGPTDYDEAIRFGMSLTEEGLSPTLIPMTPIN